MYTYVMKYESAVKNSECYNLHVKWMRLEDILVSEVSRNVK